MLWFTLHNIMQNFEFMSNQTKNLTTFVVGVTIYTLFYSYMGSIDFSRNLFAKGFFNFFYYIVLADAFAMGIIYKNYYKYSIFNEVRETIGAEKVVEKQSNCEQCLKDMEDFNNGKTSAVIDYVGIKGECMLHDKKMEHKEEKDFYKNSTILSK